MTKTIELTATPKLGELYVQAAIGAVPVPGIGASRGKRIPDRAIKLGGVRVDADNLAEYADVCGLRFGDTLPLTYPFVITMPTVMQLLVAKDFPFSPIGLVHAENV